MWGKPAYRKKSFLFTSVFTVIIVLGYMLSYTVINSFELKCWPFFVVTMVLMFVKSIVVSYKGKWTITEVMSEVEMLAYSATFFIPLGLTFLFAEEIGIGNWLIFLNYLIFFPANLIIYFCYLWLKTLYYRWTGKTIEKDCSL